MMKARKFTAPYSIDDRLSAQLSVIPHVFLDPTQLPADTAADPLT